MTELYGEKAVLFCCVVLFLVFLILFIRSEEKTDEKERMKREKLAQ